jgi:hypothetical protein
MNHNQDLWRCHECGNDYGRHDLWFDGVCEPCNERSKPRCRGCDSKENVQEQCDAYGYSTGYWCDECYDSDKYPYRKDKYFDPSLANERLEDDY